MGKEFRNVFLISLAIVLLLPLLLGGINLNDFLFGVAILSLVLSLIHVLIGLILAISRRPGSPDRKYAMAFLLTAGILLLGSWTLCSSSAVRFL